ncbi:nuclear transport factor 2 family protein [Nonomuraea salmonea]|uniref:nuclear transport factor 2 family protein n=1 Tax=Nonomuraea salmonea TaxID=46181 RepID=UPI002FEC15A5
MDAQEIADRSEITELLARYTRAVDSGHWDLLDEVFTPDASIDYRSSGGISGTRDEVKAWLAEVLSHWPGRSHLVGAATFAFCDGEARVSAPFLDTLAPHAGDDGRADQGVPARRRLVPPPSPPHPRRLAQRGAGRGTVLAHRHLSPGEGDDRRRGGGGRAA